MPAIACTVRWLASSLTGRADALTPRAPTARPEQSPGELLWTAARRQLEWRRRSRPGSRPRLEIDPRSVRDCDRLRAATRNALTARRSAPGAVRRRFPGKQLPAPERGWRPGVGRP